ncbi:MAG: sugar transferase [Candidatus Yonathbacteria bacterium CG_4_10_14_3_um_filter_43_12]|uniref:Sugar transferase n=1 Tax=Candidatus Yonathbacteria bacterium CG_4_10_14_0_8_um_filter_43_17 TaxID=1975099 RepID=A0A2M7Q6V0_9BACT|nr:MAG: sugar transferase [Candidatus Yonathbacteria bacterium CG_4_10_14_3_um_filter_43_12]PIY58805.1 MAG: sugar transferase [Candidatus Yonathbacteria bacterium CG_4_10_14_0_8_um_filter_43_17]
MIRAPIALFAYKRLDHLRRTIDALRINNLAFESDLHIYSDGPRNNGDEKEVGEVRSYIKSLDGGFKSININLSEVNKGLAVSIVEGVSYLVNKYGFVIVVEDDVVTSNLFLSFMNDSLDKYKDTESVMHVSGYSFPMKEKLPEVFLSQMPFVWGWATWKRAWVHYNDDATMLLNGVNKVGRNKFNYDGTFNFTSPLEQNARGTMKTWAIKWQASIFIKGGVSLTPFPSYTNNIGHDGTGEHTTLSNEYYNKVYLATLPNKLLDISESQEGRVAIKNFLEKIKPSMMFLVYTKIKKILNINKEESI